MKTGLAACLCLLGLGWSQAAWAEKPLAAVLLSRNLAPYQEAQDGFEAAGLFRSLSFQLEGDVGRGSQVLTEAMQQGAELLIAIGPEAVQATQSVSVSVPVVFMMVLDKPDASAQMSGVLLQVDPSAQFERIRQILPGAKTLGVIYNPTYSKTLIFQARDTAKRFGLSLVPLAVENQTEVQIALPNFTAGKVDAIWLITDKTVAHPAVVKQIIEHALEEKIPLFGLSEYHVKAGAFAAFSVDFQNIGRQTARLAEETMRTQRFRVDPPQDVITYVNPAIRNQLGIKDLGGVPNIRLVE